MNAAALARLDATARRGATAPRDVLGRLRNADKVAVTRTGLAHRVGSPCQDRDDTVPATVAQALVHGLWCPACWKGAAR